MLGAKGAVQLEDFKQGTVPGSDWETVNGYELVAGNWSTLRNITGASASFVAPNQVTLVATANTVSGDILVTAKRKWTDGDFRCTGTFTILSASRNAGNKFIGFHAFMVADDSVGFPADPSTWPADGSGITSTPITSNTVADHCRGIVHFFAQCVNPGVLPGDAMRLRLMDFDPNTPVVTGWIPNEQWANDTNVTYSFEVTRRGTKLTNVQRNLVTGSTRSSTIDLTGIATYNDGWFAFRIWDGNTVRIDNLKMERWTGTTPPPPPDQWDFGSNWRDNWVLHASATALSSGAIQVLQEGNTVEIITQETETGSVNEGAMLVSKAELPAEDHEVVIAATSIGADTSSGPNGKFNRLWMFDGEGTTSYPLDPSKWSTNYQPGNTSVRPHAKGILVTWHPYNQGVPANNDQLRVHGYEFTDAMSTLGQSPQAFPFTPSASPYFFETSKRGNILAFKAIPPTGIGETTAEFQTTDLAEIGARYGKHLGISVHRRRQKLRIVRVKVLDIAPPPPPDLIPPRVNTSGYFDLGTASSASALATKITNADSLTNCKVRMTGDIASDFTISKKMAPNMELAIDLGGNKLIDTNIFCNKMEGITFHNGIFYGSTQTRAGRISFNGGAKRCRVSDIEVFGSGYDNTLDASAPVAEVSSIIVDRCTVDKRFLDANRTSVANNTLCGSGGGESQSFFKLASTSGFEGNNCRDFIVAKIFFKYAICPGSGPGVGKSKPTNGYDAQVRALMCRWTSNMKFCYQIHNKCGGVWVMGCDIEGDDGWQFLNRHGIDNYWMGCYLRKNGMLRLMDYDGIMANCEAAPGVTGAGAQIYGGTQQADWPKGDLPNLTSFYARCINTIIYNNRGPMDIVIGNMPESSKDSNGNYIYSHYPPKNIQVWPHAAGIISKGSTPGSTWVDKTGTPAQWIVDLSNKFQPRPLVEGVDVGRGAN